VRYDHQGIVHIFNYISNNTNINESISPLINT